MKIPILTFHKVGEVRSKYWISRESLLGQLKLLKSLGYEAITMAQMARGEFTKKPVVLTFDDAYQNFLTDAMPVLDRVGMRATVFVPTGFIGRTNEWENYDITPVPHLTRNQILQLHNAGIDFQSHTVNHKNLIRLTPDERRNELLSSREYLKQLLVSPCDVFCYPGGGYDADAIALIKELGYTMAVCCDQGVEDVYTMDPYLLKRVTNYSELI